MNGKTIRRSIRLAAFAGAAVGAAACSDSVSPTSLSPRTDASHAGGGGTSIIKSMSGLEPLIDGTINISAPYAISDLGQVVGFSRNSSNENRAVIWENSIFPQDLGTLGGPSAVARGITPDGSVIIGSATRVDGASLPVRWVRPNGVWTIDELPLLDGAIACEAVDIGGNGTIVGSCLTGTAQIVVVWRNGVVTGLGPGQAAAVSNNNQLLVNVSNQPQIWDLRTSPFTVTLLGKLAGNETTGKDINDAGDVVGSARFDGPSSHAFLWTAKRGMVELLGSGGEVDAQAINNAGQIAGTDYGTGRAHAAYWSKGKFYDLGVLPGYTASFSAAINAVGQIAGASSATSALRSTLWSVK